jgi:hypothetical protein
MPYNPGVQDMSGQLRAQGKLAQVQGVASGLSSGFESYQQNKMRNQALQGENEGLLKIFMQDGETKKYAPAGIEQYLKKAESGGGMTLDDNIRLNNMLNSAIKTRGVIDQQNQAAADAGFRKAAAIRLDEENTRLQEFRKSLATGTAQGKKTLGDYNTFMGQLDKEEQDYRLNKPFEVSQMTGPASASPGMQGMPGMPSFEIDKSKAFSGPPTAVSKFDSPGISNRDPRAPEQSLLSMQQQATRANQEVNQNPQINMPQSVFGVTPRQGPVGSGYRTPEEIQKLVYDYLPGSDSAMQRILGYGGAITPDIMTRENQIQAGMDKSQLMDARSQAIAANTEQRRMEARIRQAASDAQNAVNAVYARNADARGQTAEERAEAAATRASKLGFKEVLTQQMGSDKQNQIDSIDREIRSKPLAQRILDKLTRDNFVVPKSEMSKVEKLIEDTGMTPEAKDALRKQIRVSK